MAVNDGNDRAHKYFRRLMLAHSTNIKRAWRKKLPENHCERVDCQFKDGKRVFKSLSLPSPLPKEK